MVGSNRIRYLYASSNTAQGYYSFLPDMLAGLKKVYALTGSDVLERSGFIRGVGESLRDSGYEVEFWLSPLSIDVYEGTFFPQLEIALVDGSLIQPAHSRTWYANIETINFDRFLQSGSVLPYKQDLEHLVHEIEVQNEALRQALQAAGQCQKAMAGYGTSDHKLNREKVDGIVQSIIRSGLPCSGQEKHYFANAIILDGIFDHIDIASSGSRSRYILDGPPDSGQREVMAGLAAYTRDRGYDIEYYHDGLQTEKVIMIILPAFQMAVIDGSSCKIISRPGDIVVSMSGRNTAVQTWEWEINRVLEGYLHDAQSELGKKYACLKEMEKLYFYVLDFETLNQYQQTLSQEIKNGIIK